MPDSRMCPFKESFTEPPALRLAAVFLPPVPGRSRFHLLLAEGRAIEERLDTEREDP
jgi:hypothetical protein